MTDRSRTEVDWEDLRHFLALAREGSLSAAARSLHVNHATVSRRLAALEGTLGCALFDRRGGRYRLTSEGELALEKADAMEKGALAIRDGIVAAGTDLRGAVRLTTIPSLADDFLIPRLGALAGRHPGLDIEMITEARVSSLARREADLALRLGRPEEGELVGRRVARIAYGWYASPAWRERILAGEPPLMIGYDLASDFVPEAVWLWRHCAQRRFVFRANSHTSQRAAARAGLGVALLPRYLGDVDGALARLEFDDLPPEREIWLLGRRDVVQLPRVRAVADALVEMFRRERALLAGTAGAD